MKMFKIAAVAIFALSLSGCNSEPSESDIQQAAQKNIDDTNAQARKVMSGSSINSENMLTKLNSLRKIACDPNGSNSQYKCKVELDITAPFVGHRKNIVELNVIDDNGEWRLVQ